MTKSVKTNYFEEANDHKAQLLNEHTGYNFSIEITECMRTEDIPSLYVTLLQRGELKPIFESKYVDLLVKGDDTQMRTMRFTAPFNPDPNHYKVPYLIVISADVPDVEMEDFEFIVNCHNIMV